MSHVTLPMDQVLTWRRHIHQNPELSFEEFKTADYIASELSKVPGLVITRPTATGVVATLKGEAGPGKTIAFRADMDALPVQEENDLPYKSQNPGVMHACGHDMHSAMLMGAATVLAGMRQKLRGEIRFLFQPAEELPPGGAIAMVKAGVLEGVDHVFGLHVMLGDVGTVNILQGKYATSSCDDCLITVHGKGGGSSQPHLAIDPVMIGAKIICELHTIVSRNIKPGHFAVVSPSMFHGGKMVNIIPETSAIGVDIRARDPKDRETLLERVIEVAEGVAAHHGAHVTFEWHPGYESIAQDLDLVKEITQVALDEMGPEKVTYSDALPGSEDYSEFAKAVPSAVFFTIGGGHESMGCFPNHHPKFNMKEECMESGVRMEVAIAKHFLGV